MYLYYLHINFLAFTANYTLGCLDKENAFHMTVLSYVIYQFGPA